MDAPRKGAVLRRGPWTVSTEAATCPAAVREELRRVVSRIGVQVQHVPARRRWEQEMGKSTGTLVHASTWRCAANAKTTHRQLPSFARPTKEQRAGACDPWEADNFPEQCIDMTAGCAFACA